METPALQGRERAVVHTAGGGELNPNGVAMEASGHLKLESGAQSFGVEATRSERRDEENQGNQDVPMFGSETRESLDEVEARATPTRRKGPEIVATAADDTPEDWELAGEEGPSRSPLSPSSPDLTTKFSMPMSAEELLRIR